MRTGFLWILVWWVCLSVAHGCGEDDTGGPFVFDGDTDKGGDTDADGDGDELCESVAAYYEDCEVDDDSISEFEDCCGVFSELFTANYMTDFTDCLTSTSCDDLRTDDEVKDACADDNIADTEPDDAQDAVVEAYCDHMANDCDEADEDDCNTDFWDDPDDNDWIFYLVVKDEILEEITDCLDDLDDDACDEEDILDCMYKRFEEMDACGEEEE